MFPRPVLPATQPCARCRKSTRVDRLVQGFGSDCAAKLGLIATAPRLHIDAQTGPDLLDLLRGGDDHDEPDDCCDGEDR